MLRLIYFLAPHSRKEAHQKEGKRSHFWTPSRGNNNPEVQQPTVGKDPVGKAKPDVIIEENDADFGVECDQCSDIV